MSKLWLLLLTCFSLPLNRIERPCDRWSHRTLQFREEDRVVLNQA